MPTSLAGTVVDNTANASHLVPPSVVPVSQQSNMVSVIVQPQEALTLTGSQNVTRPPGAHVVLLHRLTNTGNVPTTYVLTLSNLAGGDYTIDALALMQDVNSNGVVDGGDYAIPNGSPVTIQPGQWIDLLVTGTLPAGLLADQRGRAELTAVSQLQGVSASNVDTLVVSNSALLQLSQSASTLTPARGSLVDLVVAATNIGNQDAGAITIQIDGNISLQVLLRTPIPDGTLLNGVTGSGPGQVLYHVIGAPALKYVSIPPMDLAQVDEVAYAMPAFPPGQTVSVAVKVLIGNTAATPVLVMSSGVYGDGGSNVINVASNSVSLSLSALPKTLGFFRSLLYSAPASMSRIGDSLFIQASAPDCDLGATQTEAIQIFLTSSMTGDTESFMATETSPHSGLFRIAANMVTVDATLSPVISGDGIIQTRSNDTIMATFEACGSGLIQAGILIDPSGVAFDSRSNVPVAGVSVTLIDVTGNGNGGNPGGAASVRQVDGISPAASTVITGPDGRYSFPFVGAGTYKLMVVPPPAHTVPSTVAIGDLPSGHIIDPSGSYGSNFSLNAATAAVSFDVPLDASGNAGLFVQMTASKTVVELGDVLDYTISVRNISGVTLTDIHIENFLPLGFSYQPGSTRIGGKRAVDPAVGQGPALDFLVGQLADNASVDLVYRVRLGPAAMRGDGINKAQARSSIPLTLTSNLASTKIRVDGGVFSEKTYILGKIFLDCNDNAEQDSGEPGIPGVRLFMENGNYVISDQDGKYSFYGITPQTHVLKVDRSTMPSGAKLIVTGQRNAGNSGSRFIDLKSGELHRADFASNTCTDEVKEQIESRRQSYRPLSPQASPAPIAQSRAVVSGGDMALPQMEMPAGQPDTVAQPLSGAAPDFTISRAVASQAVSAPAAQQAGQPTLQAAGENAFLEPARRNQMEEMALLDNHIAFVDLKNRQVVPSTQIRVRVKGASGGTFILKVNGAEIAASRVGTRSVQQTRQLEVWEYIGIDLKPGSNQLEIGQRDAFGNYRSGETIELLAPGALARIQMSGPMQGVLADGKSIARIRVELVDEQGLPVMVRTPVMLEASLGVWQVDDLNPTEAGVQTFLEGGRAELVLMAPTTPGEALLHISSGRIDARERVQFVPELREMEGVGLIEGTINLNRMSGNLLSPGRDQDGFEQGLRNFSQSDNGSSGGRVAWYLKGKIEGDYLLTSAYDSAKAVGPDAQERMFRDIQPDLYYPVYGDSAGRGFDAQSTGRFYVRIDKSRSYLLYGDFNTPTAAGARNLGAYSRSMTGLSYKYSDDPVTVNAFASRDSTRQIVDAFPANGTSGPFVLNVPNLVENSEKVEILVRSRNQPAIILASMPQNRFIDYMVEPLTGRILFRAPVSSVDPELNPVEIRVTYEVDQGGEQFWTTGVDIQLKMSDGLEIGGAAIQGKDPLDPYDLYSLNATLRLTEKNALILEGAQSNRMSLGAGKAMRAEFTHKGEVFDARVYAGQTDTNFDNPSALLSRGRGEAGAKANYRMGEDTALVGEYLRTEDRVTGDTRMGGMLSVEQGLGQNLHLQLGIRRSSGSVQAIPLSGVAAGIPDGVGSLAAPTGNGNTPTTGGDGTTSLHARLAGTLPDMPAASLYGEVEQAIGDDEKRMAALGGEYRFENQNRLYARHEFINSLTNIYGLADNQRQNTTVLGLDTAYMDNGRLFSEYRGRDVSLDRGAEMAIGLRNLYQLAEGVRASTTYERIQALSGSDGNEATASTIAIEYARDPRWKSTARLERRISTANNSVLGTLGTAYRISSDWSLLLRNTLNRVASSNGSMQMGEWLQIGMAYRETDRNRVNGLAKYEFKREDDTGLLAAQRRVHLASTHVNYQPNKEITYSGQYAAKVLYEDSEGIVSRTVNHLISGRVTYDFFEKWDAGAVGRALFSGGFRSVEHGVGVEVGRVLRENVWLSMGYNLFGFRDKDLQGSDYLDRGVYVRLRMKFDESLTSMKGQERAKNL